MRAKDPQLHTDPATQFCHYRNSVKALIDAYNEGVYGKSSGSQIVWGQLLVILVVDTIIYVEPLYPQSEAQAIPELKR